MSMKNQDTWVFAHHYCGKIWYICGLILLVVSLIVLLLVMGKSNDAIGNVGGILCVFQMIPLVGSIIPTEIALRKNFDKYGNMVPVGESFPAYLPSNIHDKVCGECQRVFDLLDFKFGTVNLEFFVTQDDKIMILEIGPRSGGNLMPRCH